MLSAIVLIISSCNQEIPPITPSTGNGNYHADLSEFSGATTGYYDCSDNELTLNSGDLMLDYNVVVNANNANANAHLLLNNLRFTTSDPSVSYHGNFDLKLNAHIAKGQVFTFSTGLKLVGQGTANKLSASVDIHAVYNANGTITVQNVKITPGCN